MNSLSPSELILNEDGSVYHLKLLPEDIAETILLVGDPDRTELVAKHFDSILIKKQHREFKTITGIYNKQRLSVVSTGIGTDNIDIVLNELDALVNIDLSTRTIKSALSSLNLIRIGTSGSLRKEIPIDSLLISEYAIGLEGLMNAYDTKSIRNSSMENAFIRHCNWNANRGRPCAVSYSKTLAKNFEDSRLIKGLTLTAGGFYAPQNRKLRLPSADISLPDKFHSFSYENKQITNLEMETAGIYALAKLLGHRAISLNVILANRKEGTFSTQAKESIAKLIEFSLDKINSSL